MMGDSHIKCLAKIKFRNSRHVWWGESLQDLVTSAFMTGTLD